MARGNRHVLEALAVGPYLPRRRQRRWCQHLGILRKVERMAHPAGVHELDKYFPTLAVNGIGRFLPPGHLGFTENAGDP